MKADFLDAHNRHWKDAELLFNAKRWANADHLYGLAVECGLKQLMVALGMSVDSTTGSPIDQKHLFHADRAWTCFESYCSGHHNGAGYKLPQKDPFFDWKISQRYAHQNKFSQKNVEPHRQGAEVVYQLIQKAKIGGLIS